MNQHRRKKIAPIVVTILVIVYYMFYFMLLMYLLPGVFKWFFGLIPIVMGIGTLYVCKQRLDEIDGGEEDDLGKY